ncbi:MAG: hypothetical protein HY425_00570, partial [Candidatus Levybacteria bacterium]|nr:hypothetical protein [Candidatus Levybacteria bacterium]
MNFSDFLSVVQWWTVIFIIGAIFIPITNLILSNFFDKGYIFSKIIGTAAISYAVFVLGFLKILPFTQATIFIVIALFAGINILIFKKKIKLAIKQFDNEAIKIIIFEEALFLGVLFFWSFIHAHQPDIHGLEKYMDYGFINSILRAKYFPPLDMWFTPFSINYYYFGHLVTAVLTKLSLLPSPITFNLMLSTISALSFVSAFSIGANLFKILMNKGRVAKEEGLPTPLRLKASRGKTTLESAGLPAVALAKVGGKLLTGPVLAGLLTAFILNFAGNLHTLHLFFKPYLNENPVPFWNLIFSPQTFPNNYWYPNATRFIENTIHEFPIYSSVVSDLHGHFLDLPFVLLTIAILLSLVLKSQITNHKSQINLNVQNSKRFGFFNFRNLNLFGTWNFEFRILLLAFLLAIMYMTNAWDGIIYFILATLIIGYTILKSLINPSEIINSKFKNFITLFIHKILLLGLF